MTGLVSLLRQTLDTIRLLPQGGPSCCNIAVTNVCNATCDFCGYAKDKILVNDWIWIDYDDTLAALDILYDRGVRYLTFSGGEPLLHPRLLDMVAYAVAKGMRPSIITNGSPLTPRNLEKLKTSGLKTLFISIDSPDAAAHEANRGLKGVFARIRQANAALKPAGIKTVASVTINRLIDDYERLAHTLRELGFETVTFTYPKRELHSSSLVFSDSSSLIDFSDDELVERLEAVKRLKRRFSVLNPAESLSEMIRFVRGEPQMFPCFGGAKYFYLDYKMDVYRCDFWATRMCSIWEFKDAPAIRDGCTKCMSVCYRDSSVLLHFPVSLGDALGLLRRGRLAAAARTLMTTSNRRSLKALMQEWRTLKKLAKVEPPSSAVGRQISTPQDVRIEPAAAGDD
ncbi:MAG: radical SAM protein [Kiloniellales bacterium]